MRLVRPLQGLAALGLITAGVALWSLPAAFIVAGCLILVDRLT